MSAALVIAAAAWGLYWIPLRDIEAVGISGVWSVVFFNACPLLPLLPLLALRWRDMASAGGASMRGPTLLAAAMVGLAFTFYANALIETTVVRATLLYFLTPIWSTILGVLLLSERMTVARGIAIVVALAGLALLLSNGTASDLPLNVGDLYGLLAGIFWAFGMTALKRWDAIPILPLTALAFLFTTMLSACFAWALFQAELPDPALLVQAFPTAAFWSIAVLVPSFCVIFRVAQFLYPGRVGILTMSEAVVAILSASILLPQETMSALQWLGAALILFAAVVEVGFGARRRRAQRVARI